MGAQFHERNSYRGAATTRSIWRKCKGQRDKSQAGWNRHEAVNAMLLNEFLKEHRTVQELKGTVAQQQKQIDALTTGLQKVAAQLEAAKPAARIVSGN